MNIIYVKPAPSLSAAAAKVLKSDTGVGLLDVAGNVPEAGMPWPNGGLTLRLLADGAILRADDPAFVVADTPATPVEPSQPAVPSAPSAEASPTVSTDLAPVSAPVDAKTAPAK